MKGCVWKRFSVNGCEHLIYVPRECNWISKDKNERIYVWVERPVLGENKSEWFCGPDVGNEHIAGWPCDSDANYIYYVFTDSLDNVAWDKSLRRLR